MPRAALHAVAWALLASYAAAFIVPEELVSFLSIVYSNIPPVRKGTDSRVGLGFRLGPHADAQVILELGPQTNTRPLGAGGPNFGSASTSSKRHSPQALVLEDAAPAALNPAAGNWLTAWRTSVAAHRPAALAVDDDLVNQADLSAPGAVDIPDPTRLSGAPLVSHLRQLYRKENQHEQQQQELTQPERQSKWQSEPWPLLAPTKPTKRGKAKSKTTASITSTTRRPADGDLSTDLRDVSLD